MTDSQRSLFGSKIDILTLFIAENLTSQPVNPKIFAWSGPTFRIIESQKVAPESSLRLRD